MRNFLSGFRENDGNSYYQLKMWYEDAYILYDVYLDYESAYLAGLAEGGHYRIDKDMFAGKKKSGRTDVLGMIEYNPDGSLGKRVWLYEVGDDENNNAVDGTEFCSGVVNLPLCFKRGDIVTLFSEFHSLSSSKNIERYRGFSVLITVKFHFSSLNALISDFAFSRSSL